MIAYSAATAIAGKTILMFCLCKSPGHSIYYGCKETTQQQQQILLVAGRTKVNKSSAGKKLDEKLTQKEPSKIAADATFIFFLNFIFKKNQA